MRFKDATPAQLLALRTRLTPVLDRLASDPLNGPLLAKIKAVAQENAASETLKVDNDCRKGVSVDESIAGTIPRSMAAIPDGAYRVQISTDEVLAAGLDNHDGISGTWTLSIRDGKYQLRCQPVSTPGQDCGGSTQSEPLEWGELRGKGNVVYLVSDGRETHESGALGAQVERVAIHPPRGTAAVGSWSSSRGRRSSERDRRRHRRAGSRCAPHLEPTTASGEPVGQALQARTAWISASHAGVTHTKNQCVFNPAQGNIHRSSLRVFDSVGQSLHADVIQRGFLIDTGRSVSLDGDRGGQGTPCGELLQYCAKATTTKFGRRYSRYQIADLASR